MRLMEGVEIVICGQSISVSAKVLFALFWE